MKAHERSRLGLGYVPQGRGILPGLTALENLRLAWTADSGDTEAAAIERVVDTLPRLRALLDRKGGALSGGEQQILALGRALMPAPWLLLLDEPSEGIQPSIVQEIGEILAALRKRDKLSLLIVEQNLDLVLDVADRIVVIERGRIEREVDAHVVQAGGARRAARHGRAAPGEHERGRPATALADAARAGDGAGAPRAPARHDTRRRHATVAARRRPLRCAATPPTSPARAPSAPTPVNRGDTMSMVKRPTIEQLQEIVASLHMSMSEREVGEYLDVLEGTMQAYDRVDAAARLPARGALPAHARHTPIAGREPARRLVRQVRGEGRAVRAAGRQARRAEGQHLPGRRADDERRLDARRLRARRRRDRRHAHPRRRRHDRRQGALRVLLPVRRQPHVGRAARCTTRTSSATRPAARRAAAPRWSAPARSRWRSAATRAARSACRGRSPASTA